MIQSYLDYKLPDVPENLKKINIPALKVEPYASVWDNLPSPKRIYKIATMEYFDQQSAFILYSSSLNTRQLSSIEITEVQDYANLFINN